MLTVGIPRRTMMKSSAQITLKRYRYRRQDAV